MTSEQIVERLRGWGAPAKQRAKPLMNEAAAEITSLQEALAAAEARIAETRKKALEEAAAHLKAKAEEMRGTPVGAAMAAIFDEQAAAIRSLSAEEAQ